MFNMPWRLPIYLSSIEAGRRSRVLQVLPDTRFNIGERNLSAVLSGALLLPEETRSCFNMFYLAWTCAQTLSEFVRAESEEIRAALRESLETKTTELDSVLEEMFRLMKLRWL